MTSKPVAALDETKQSGVQDAETSMPSSVVPKTPNDRDTVIEEAVERHYRRILAMISAAIDIQNEWSVSCIGVVNSKLYERLANNKFQVEVVTPKCECKCVPFTHSTRECIDNKVCYCAVKKRHIPTCPIITIGQGVAIGLNIKV